MEAIVAYDSRLTLGLDYRLLNSVPPYKLCDPNFLSIAYILLYTTISQQYQF